MNKTNALLFIGIFWICSCNKTAPFTNRTELITPGNTNVKFLMVSPDAPQANFFINGVKISGVTPGATGVVLGMTYGALYPATIGYALFASGSLKIDAKVTDSSLAMPGAVISSTTQTFDANKFYTYVVLDSLNKITTVKVEDDPAIPDISKAYFRIANFVSNTATVNVEILKTSGGAPYFKSYPGIAFKSVTTFDTLGAGAGQVYKVSLKNPITNATLDSIAAFTPSNNRKYTIYGRGVFGLTGSNIKRPIITNFINF